MNATMNKPAFQAVSATAAQELLREGAAILIDVREPDEHARERIEGAILMPLSKFDARKVPFAAGKRVIFHCKGGARSADAARMAAAAAPEGAEILSLEGGIQSWMGQGLPYIADSGGPRISILRQVQLAIGLGVLAGTVAGAFVDPWFLMLPAFFGAGLAFAGATGTCGLAVLLSMMPWNRTAGASCSTGRCG